MNAFKFHKPDHPIPLIFDSPHSGAEYPDDFNYACDFKTLKSAEDHFVEELFAHTPSQSATFLTANFPRSYLDVNRAIDDIDLELLDEPWSGEINPAPTSRSHAGIGLIRRLIRPGVPVYERALTSAEIMHRINSYYRPYHGALETLINEMHYNFGQVWHINCHSMPSSSAYPKRVIGLIGNRPKPVDFVLGDRDGTSCEHHFTRALSEYIRILGYTVSINDPFKGVELVEKYSNPATGYNSLQIEINKSLYMHEKTGKKKKEFDQLQSAIKNITAFCAQYVQSRLTNLAAD